MSPISSTTVPNICPQCGATLTVPTAETKTTCPSCQTPLKRTESGRWEVDGAAGGYA